MFLKLPYLWGLLPAGPCIIMEEKIKPTEIAKYSKEYAQEIVARFFQGKSHITGREILHLCPVRQVNLMVLRELMNAWTSETARLKSPFFDYDAPEVQEVYRQFQNVLSNHIKVARAEFTPLLEMAVSRTLMVILAPYDYYASVLDNKGRETLSFADLKNEVRYLKINQAPLEKLVQSLGAGQSQETIPGKEAFALLDGILEEVNFSPEEPDKYMAELSKTRPVSAARFFEVVGAPPPPKKITPPPVKKPMAVHQTTLYDQLAPAETKTSLAENFQRQKIARLRDSLSINQKFMFTKMLFNGDFEIFSQALERLDMMDNLQQAERYLTTEYPEWDRESEECQEFMLMVQKRFSEEG